MLAEWEAMLADAQVQKVTNQDQLLFRLDRTAVYKPIVLTVPRLSGTSGVAVGVRV
jgi:hypothetical protein